MPYAAQIAQIPSVHIEAMLALSGVWLALTAAALLIDLSRSLSARVRWCVGGAVALAGAFDAVAVVHGQLPEAYAAALLALFLGVAAALERHRIAKALAGLVGVTLLATLGPPPGSIFIAGAAVAGGGWMYARQLHRGPLAGRGGLAWKVLLALHVLALALSALGLGPTIPGLVALVGLASAVGAASAQLGQEVTKRQALVEQSEQVQEILDEKATQLKLANLELQSHLAYQRSVEQELAAARDEAMRSVRMKSEFLATMSHEIRTPMNGVIGMTGLLLETDLSKDQRSYAESVRKCGDVLLAIINDILDFSKIEAGKLVLEELEFDVVKQVETLAELLSGKAREKQLELLTYVEPDVPTLVVGDPGRLGQILTNLIGNALKFTSTGQVVVRISRVEANEADVLLRFSVEDSGIGIPEHMRSQIFESFTQADGSTTRQFGGTGLGLTISQRLSVLMGGEIGVSSAEGEGSTFWFTARVGVADATATPTCLGGRRALVAYDNPIVRDLLVRLLTTIGLAVEGVETAQLTKALAERLPDLVLVDNDGPSDTGWATLGRSKRLPTVVATWQQLETTPPHILSIAKPLRQSHIVAACRELLLGSRSATQRRKVATEVANLGQSQRLLVAEDNIVNQKLITVLLGKLGFQTDLVANGEEALEALERTSYCGVLMDCQMPVVDGFEATRRIRSLPDKRNETVVIALTANAMKGDRERCLEAGMDDYLSKPVRILELRRVLTTWFANQSSAA